MDSKERVFEVCKTQAGDRVMVLVTGFNTARLIVRDRRDRTIVTIENDDLDELGWALKELVEERPRIRNMGPVKPPYGTPERAEYDRANPPRCDAIDQHPPFCDCGSDRG